MVDTQIFKLCGTAVVGRSHVLYAYYSGSSCEQPAPTEHAFQVRGLEWILCVLVDRVEPDERGGGGGGGGGV